MPLCECVWMCDGERGSGPEGADDLCSVSMEVLGWDMSPNVPDDLCLFHLEGGNFGYIPQS